jgi:hypothetical protein
LRKALGDSAIISLIRLGLWAATNSIDGWLPSDSDDISRETEQLVFWSGESGELFRLLVRLKYIDNLSAALTCIDCATVNQALHARTYTC